jgi:NAD(P)H-hydrate epimerase
MTSRLPAAAAAALDAELMSGKLYTLDSLMELAGYCVAQACVDAFPSAGGSRVLVCCGPGNNGGDGLVAARHLITLGYQADVLCPRATSPQHARLISLCAALGIPVHSALSGLMPLQGRFSFVVDAVLGFSSRGALRAPFDEIMGAVVESGLGVIAVDIPSGWEVDQAQPPAPYAYMPQALLSLTASKPCAEHFERSGGKHYLGLRGIAPLELQQKYGLAPSPPATPGLGGLARLQ